MKPNNLFLAILIGCAFLAPSAHARGESRDRGNGGSRASAPKRSPMTGSKMERPVSRPQPKPVARPETKPMPRPEAKPMPRPEAKPMPRPEAKPMPRPETKPAPRPVERPSVQKPSIQRPETRPGNLPDRKPELDRPQQGPETRPGNGPDRRPELDRPQQRPDNRPGNGPDRRPELDRPSQRPDNIPGRRPDQRPSLDRPDQNRPNSLPGMVTYPNRPDKGRPNRIDHNQINSNNRTNVHIDKINVNRRNVGLNRPANLPANRRHNWDSNRWGGNRGVWGNNNNVNIKINNNFRYNNNFSYRPNHWGARPWWGASTCHTWHHGHWGYGYNSNYYHRHWYYKDDDFASGFMWGIAVWSLGNMIYDMGYQSYRNPYPAPPVQNTYITYTQPVSVAAAANPPGDEKAVEIAEAKSAEALDRSRAAFRKGDYLAASKAVDEALAHTPGDVSLHEFRALVFFALGKYPDAAGVLNPVLASGPGWSWDTMVGFYSSSDTYSGQLRKLEDYTKGAPDKADAVFLLGYHYMVCGHMDKAYDEFAKASKLQPADSISRQLRDLTAASIPDAGETEAAPSEMPEPIQPDQLVGTWVSDRGADGKVTFTMTAAGDYTWSYMNAGNPSEMKGTYGLNDKGLLVLTSDDTQMVSVVEIKDSKMQFVLIGAPDGDPGLEFTKG